MQNELYNIRQIQWIEYGNTMLHPLAISILIFMSILALIIKKQFIILPILIVAVFLTHMQRIVISTLDFSMIRLILIVVVLRSIIRNDMHKFEWRITDKLLLWYVIVSSFSYIILRLTLASIINRLGFAFETLLAYFIVRVYIKNIKDVIFVIKVLAIISLVVALFMTIEQFTHKNLFSVFGGVAEITPVREGRLRAQGAFSHSIMAGSFGAAFMPLFWGLRNVGKNHEKIIGTIGIISSFVIVWASSSSGPVLALMGAIFYILLWNVRDYIKYIKYFVVILIVCLHLVMKAPVWHLIARIDIVGGSTGWHRYYLIDQTIKHFSEWFLFGVRTTGHWGWGLNDVTNMFISQGVNGGFLAFSLFFLIIKYSFNTIKITMRELSSQKKKARIIWAWGAVLFTHCVSFLGVSYFGQMYFFWVFTLAMISCLSSASDFHIV
jgi:hypothetical protein